MFAQNRPFDNAQFYTGSLTVGLPSPIDSTLLITRAAHWLLKQIYRPAVYYQKTGVMVMDLVPKSGQQGDLFSYNAGHIKDTNLMTVMDTINKKYAKGTIKLAGEGIECPWKMRRSFKSPNHTGNWDELPKII